MCSTIFYCEVIKLSLAPILNPQITTEVPLANNFDSDIDAECLGVTSRFKWLDNQITILPTLRDIESL